MPDKDGKPEVIIQIPEVMLNAPLPEGVVPEAGHWIEFTETTLEHYSGIADGELSKLEAFFEKDETKRILEFTDVDTLVLALKIYGITPRPSEELFPAGALEIYVSTYAYPTNQVAQEVFSTIESRCINLESKVLPVIERFNGLAKEEQNRYLDDPKLKEFAPFLLSKTESITRIDISNNDEYKAARAKWRTDSKVASDKSDQMETVSIIRDMESNNPETRSNAENRFNEVSKELLPTSANALNSLMALALIKDQLNGRADSTAEASYLEESGLDINTVEAIAKFVSERSDLYQRYYALKAKLLHKDDPVLKYSERTLMFSTEVPTTFAESVMLIKLVIAASGIDLSALNSQIDDYLTKGKIDITVGNGKKSGAYAFLTFPGQLPYISSGMEIPSIRGISEMSHELGHLIESLQASLDKTPGVSVNKGRGVGEVTSQYFQLAVYRYIYEQAKEKGNSKSQAEAILNIVNLELTSIYRQVSYYKFQKEVHAKFREKNKDKTLDELQKGNYTELTPEEISEIYKRNDREFMGRAVEDLSGSENWWATNPIYWGDGISNPFVDIEYAIGMIGAMNMYTGINSGDINQESVRKFIGAGSTESTSELLKLIGTNFEESNTLRNVLDDIEKILDGVNSSIQT